MESGSLPRINLTQALADPSSSVWAFFRNDLTLDEAAIVAGWKRELTSWRARYGSVGGVMTAGIGVAIETRILADLTGSVPHPDMHALLSAGQREAVRRGLQCDGMPVPARTATTTRRSSSRFSLQWPAPEVVHSLEIAYEWGSFVDLMTVSARHGHATPAAAELIWNLTPGPPLPAGVLGSLVALWNCYLARGRISIAALGQTVTAHPVFADGSAIADLITGSTLLDIKASQDPEQNLPSWMRQVLSYALLARHEGLSIESIGVYHAGEGLVITWTLQQLLDEWTGLPACGFVDIDAIARRFAAAVTADRRAVAQRQSGL
jgi:hypothetical protein